MGRTSLVRRGRDSLQVQTEYAARPNPRITTTVLNSGRVMHKIEKKLDQLVASADDQLRTERSIARQHADVVEIIENNYQEMSSPEENSASPQPVSNRTRSLFELMAAIPGVRRIYRLGYDGRFGDETTSKQFQKAFGSLFKHLSDLIEVFVELPGERKRREMGVYDIERDRLYLVSAGSEFYFLVVNRVDRETNYEHEIRKILDDITFNRSVG